MKIDKKFSKRKCKSAFLIGRIDVAKDFHWVQEPSRPGCLRAENPFVSLRLVGADATEEQHQSLDVELSVDEALILANNLLMFAISAKEE